MHKRKRKNKKEFYLPLEPVKPTKYSYEERKRLRELEKMILTEAKENILTLNENSKKLNLVK